jgi:hypothetical protein
MGDEFATFWTLWIELSHAKLMRAFRAALDAWDVLQLEHHGLPLRIFHQHFEAELQRIPVHARQFPDFNANFGDAAVGMTLSFFLHGFKDRGRNAKLMHAEIPGASPLKLQRSRL